MRSNHREVEFAKLEGKQHLQQLSLRPHHTIKALSIQGFGGERLPKWIGHLLELQHLVLRNCRYLTSLPEGLHNLTSLRTLTIDNSPFLAGDDRQKVAHIPRMDLFSLAKAGLLDPNIAGW
ncbi:hypothetical protein K1719_012611 [Acacia pycnantha]|nr:hypothetical protein K1719_012611 [Acacia pycnantha]